MATSSAWVGPDRATIFTSCGPSQFSFSSSLRITSDIVINVSGSIPFATSTITCPSGIKERAAAVVERTKIEGTANRRISFPVHTSSMDLVN